MLADAALHSRTGFQRISQFNSFSTTAAHIFKRELTPDLNFKVCHGAPPRKRTEKQPNLPDEIRRLPSGGFKHVLGISSIIFCLICGFIFWAANIVACANNITSICRTERDWNSEYLPQHRMPSDIFTHFISKCVMAPSLSSWSAREHV
jgi:hypothetical protein